MPRKTKKFTDDEKAIYRLGFLASEERQAKNTAKLPSLVADLIESIRRDENKTSRLSRQTIKTILDEITLRMDLPKDTSDSIIERD
jgi:hypothetical protein